MHISDICITVSNVCYWEVLKASANCYGDIVHLVIHQKVHHEQLVAKYHLLQAAKLCQAITTNVQDKPVMNMAHMSVA